MPGPSDFQGAVPDFGLETSAYDIATSGGTFLLPERDFFYWPLSSTAEKFPPTLTNSSYVDFIDKRCIQVGNGSALGTVTFTNLSRASYNPVLNFTFWCTQGDVLTNEWRFHYGQNDLTRNAVRLTRNTTGTLTCSSRNSSGTEQSTTTAVLANDQYVWHKYSIKLTNTSVVFTMDSTTLATHTTRFWPAAQAANTDMIMKFEGLTATGRVYLAQMLAQYTET